MELELRYDTKDAVPKGYEALYTEKDGKFVLTGVKGMKTQADIDTVQKNLKTERDLHKETKAKLADFNKLGKKPEELQETLDKFEELSVMADGKEIDDKKVNEIVEKRVAAKLVPITRERDNLKGELAEAKTAAEKLSGEIKDGKIDTALRKAAADMKVRPEALEDVVLLGKSIFDVDADGKILVKEGTKFTQGLEPGTWVSDMKKDRPHWWPVSQGGGANGGGGGGGAMQGNPWSKNEWNLTAQGQYVKQHGLQKATEAAKQAGSHLGATAPAKPAA